MITLLFKLGPYKDSMVKRGGWDSLVENLRDKAQSSRVTPAFSSFDVVTSSPLYEHHSADRQVHLFEKAVGDRAGVFTPEYFEQLPGALFGYTHRRALVIDSNGNKGYPDLLNMTGKRAYECKAVAKGGVLDIRDNQYGYLGDFQKVNPDFRLSFVVSRYHDPSVPLSEMSVNEFGEFLTREATAYMLVLPFSVVTSLAHKVAQPGNGLGFRYWGSKNWVPRSRINSSALDRMASDPKEVLEQLNLDPADYRVDVAMSPRRLICDGRCVKPFPIVRIADRSQKSWMASFLSSYRQTPPAERPSPVTEDYTEDSEREAIRSLDEANLVPELIGSQSTNGEHIPF